MAMDWIFGFAGGLAIGCACAILLLGNGRIAGISGILGEALAGRRMADGLPFLLGLIVLPAGVALGTGHPPIGPAAPWAAVLAGGLLVGFGTRMGNGCTSGHGVCGLSRLSRRSLVAVPVFMGAAGLTVFLLRHVFGGGW